MNAVRWKNMEKQTGYKTKELIKRGADSYMGYKVHRVCQKCLNEIMRIKIKL